LPKNKPRKILLNSRKSIGQNIHIHAHPKNRKMGGGEQTTETQKRNNTKQTCEASYCNPGLYPPTNNQSSKNTIRHVLSSDPTSGQIQKRPTQQPTGPKMYMQIHAYLINV